MAISAYEREEMLGVTGASPLPTVSGQLPAIAQTTPRFLPTTGSLTLTSGTLYLFGIFLTSGLTITNINFVSSATAEATGTHLWFALYRADLVLLRQTNDNTGASAFTANTNLLQALSSPVVTPYSGFYYVGICCVATTRPSLMAMVSGALSNGFAPILAGSSSAALTSTAPNPAGTITRSNNYVYAYVS